MKKILLWYNANRKSIWKVIGIVVVTIIVLQLVQYIWKQSEMAKSPTNQNNDSTYNTGITLNTITLEENKSVVSGEKITEGQASSLEVIDTFIDYCNNSKINEAYNLLSDDCKKEMYPSAESFKKSYYNTIFTGKKNISVENWVGNIYKVKYMNDALSTGVYTTEDTIQDYITLVTDNEGKTKLNINNYIGKQEIDKETEVFNIKVKVVEKNSYMDYETYTFEITNNSDAAILMSNLNNAEDMYLLDSNEIKYSAYTHELSESELKLELKETKKVTIKYYNKYGSNKKINKIVFNNIILNYNAYANYQNPGYYKDYGTIQISL